MVGEVWSNNQKTLQQNWRFGSSGHGEQSEAKNDDEFFQKKGGHEKDPYFRKSFFDHSEHS